MPLSIIETIINNIKIKIGLCADHIKTINQVSVKSDDILGWFKKTCKYIVDIIAQIGGLNKELNGKLNNRKSIVLYLTQLLTSLSLLISVFVKENDLKEVISEARHCITKQIMCCLQVIEHSLKTSSNTDADPSGNFIKWMDAALDKLGDISITAESHITRVVYDEARALAEEVLCHGMSIAQVTLEQDCKIIRGASQTVLESFDALLSAIAEPQPNAAMIGLFIDSCTNKLCQLERKVNTAVLRLCLSIFSHFTVPLDRICAFAMRKVDDVASGRNDEFDQLVIEFDLHVDRIMQIGLFAVNCSSGISRNIKIRSCLASLEALESELVPAFTAVQLDPSSHNINYALILKEHWLDQAKSLQNFIFLIIDPFAFCQIVFEEIKEIVVELSSKTTVLTSVDIDSIVNLAEVLTKFLETASKEFSTSQRDKIKGQLIVFSDVLNEVKAASNVLLITNETTFTNSLRVIKRCIILMGVVKKLWYCFVDSANESLPIHKRIDVTNNDESSKQQQPTGLNPFLDHIINRGKELLKDRSVLYRTPMKSNVGLTLFPPLEKNEAGDRQKSRLLLSNKHSRQLSFTAIASNSGFQNENSIIDLHLTEILNELSNSFERSFTKIK